MTAGARDDRIAIVIVHYRNYTDLAACLGSIDAHQQTDSAVVVDHATVPERLQEIVLQFPWVRVIATPGNPGFAAGVNRGVRDTQAPYVLILNPDCQLHEPVAEELIRYLDGEPDVAIVGPRILNPDGSVQPSARRFPGVTTALAGRRSWLTAVAPGNRWSRDNLLTSEGHTEPRTVDWVSGACMMIRRTAWEQIGGLDESFFMYWEDADACRRLKHAGWRTAYYPGVSLVHIGARSSRYNARVALVAFHLSAFRYFHRHASRLGRCLSPIAAMLLAGRLAAALLYQFVRAIGPARAPSRELGDRDSTVPARAE